jgi:hypothetical protein
VYKYKKYDNIGKTKSGLKRQNMKFSAWNNLSMKIFSFPFLPNIKMKNQTRIGE